MNVSSGTSQHADPLQTGAVEDPVPPPPRDPRRLAQALARRLSAPSIVRTRELLARHTTLRVGGPADLWIEPATDVDLALSLRLCLDSDTPWMVLGRGSNLVVRDGGFRGAVLRLSHPFFRAMTASGTTLRCGAGVPLRKVTLEARRRGLAGLEFLEGIPGSVGGALRMNAGAHGSRTFDRVVSVRVMDATGTIEEHAADTLPVGYRSCPFLERRIALAGVFLGEPAPEAAIRERMTALGRRRWETQPPQPSAGCVFKNPAALPAGRLIDELGLKGTRIGGAQISTVHANFIVNLGGATAADVLALLNLIRRRALEERGVVLENEVEIAGED